jgi:hypothetical protein
MDEEDDSTQSKKMKKNDGNNNNLVNISVHNNIQNSTNISQKKTEQKEDNKNKGK